MLTTLLSSPASTTILELIHHSMEHKILKIDHLRVEIL